MESNALLNLRQADWHNRLGLSQKILTALGWLCISWVVLLPASPLLLKTPGIDSGIFLYVGKQILAGGVLYRDLWNSSAPLVYFINALGLFFNRDNFWGVWVIQVFALWVTALIVFALLKKYFGLVPAACITAAVLFGYVYLYEFGNHPEGYALPIQILMIWMLLKVNQPKKPWLFFLGIGLLLGIATSFKQTLIASGITITVFITIKRLYDRDWKGFIDLLWIGLGFSAIWLAWVALFSAQHALSDFWEQVFYFKLFNSDVSSIERLNVLFTALRHLAEVLPLFNLGLLLWFVAVLFLFFNAMEFRKAVSSRWLGGLFLVPAVLLLINGLFDDRTGSLYALSGLSAYRKMLILTGLFLCAGAAFLLTGWFRHFVESNRMQAYLGNCRGFLVPLGIALIDFPVQIIFVGLSGSSGNHSFIPVLPSLVIFMGFITWAIFSGASEAAARQNARLWFGLFVIILILPGLFTMVDQMQHPQAAEAAQVNSVVDYLKANTLPGDRVVQWGMEGRILFMTDRQTSSRFIDQKPLFAKGSEESILLFRADLSADPPVMFVDTGQANLPLILPGSGEACGQLESDDYLEQQWRLWRDRHNPKDSSLPLPEIPQDMKQVYLWICQNYVLADRVGPDGWPVYQQRP